MDLGLAGKVVVVTGGTAGIGRACVEMFLEEGCRVAVCGRSEAKLEVFRREFAGREVLAVQADVSVEADVQRLAAMAEERFGGIDVWVNNAGVYPAADIEEMSVEDWRSTFAVNVDGVFYGARAAVPPMRKRGGGVIINAGSFAAIMPTANRGAYGVTKAAVSHLTRVLAAELAPDHIRVVAYNPGFVLTEINAPQVAEYPEGAIQRQTAANRFGCPEEIASLIVFLASERASFINGVGVEASGGKYCVQNPAMPWDKHQQ